MSEIFIIVLILLLIIESAMFYRLIKITNKKIEIYETFVTTSYEGINRAYTIIKNIDIRGAFEADDEVGEVFKIMKFEIDRLKNIIDTGVESEPKK
jgi:hypothetical protein